MSTVEEFKSYVQSVEARDNYQRPIAFGLGVRKTKDGKTLEVYFPTINYSSSWGTAATIKDVAQYADNQNGSVVLDKNTIDKILAKFKPFEEDGKEHPNIELLKILAGGKKAHSYYDTEIICYFLYDQDSPVESPEEGYFKIQCLSQLHVKPHAINCSGIFGKMNNVAWTNHGPILTSDLTLEKLRYSLEGQELVVSHVDKFPYMVNFHVPEGVRVVSGAKVRLGAHLSPGTTVMPAGYVNFNAGTLGSAMVEGRISAGVVVGNHSDIGGGASIMGTLSGGNSNVISIGKKCLLGANAGTGISLGDGCTVAAGVYITSASKISLYDKDKNPIDLDGNKVAEGNNIAKGMDINGKSYLLIYQDSQSGKIVVRPNTKLISLNESLHS